MRVANPCVAAVFAALVLMLAAAPCIADVELTAVEWSTDPIDPVTHFWLQFYNPDPQSSSLEVSGGSNVSSADQSSSGPCTICPLCSSV